MGAVSPPELAAAVSEARALGMVGTARRGITVVTLGRMLDRMQEHTTRPYGVNFVIPEQWGPPDRACIELAAHRARVVEFFYGKPNRDLVKMDRLTRSLADFAKLVELFDEHQVSFVSVTQAFNTTTSMGRLTLNVLLSFAQFEREVKDMSTRSCRTRSTSVS